MKATDVLREVAYPLSNFTVLFANVGFALIGTFVIAAVSLGPFGLFSLLLAVVSLPAFFRYALYLLEARAQGKQAPAVGIELFNLAENFWGLFPLVFLAVAVWLNIYVYLNVASVAALVLLVLFFLLYPASMAVLAITRSPLGSLNPVNVIHMIRLCGRDYLWIPTALIAVMFVISLLFRFDLWLLAYVAAAIYGFFLLFTLTGTVLHANRIMDEIDIEDPLEPSEDEIAGDLLKERRNIATHAYGFVSRGNRDGGLKHIRQRIDEEADADAACRWFFLEMMRWESKDAALFFAQDYFAHLLAEQLDNDALKLISQCLHEDPRWKPLQRDRAAALELAEKYARDDLIRSLKS
jgi:hypothetical protein